MAGLIRVNVLWEFFNRLVIDHLIKIVLDLFLGKVSLHLPNLNTQSFKKEDWEEWPEKLGYSF